MKSKYLVLILSSLFILGLGFSNAMAASTVTYLGKTTWTGTITESSKSENIGAEFTVVGGVSRIGDEFYAFQGYVTSGVDPFVLSGSGFLMGTELIFTLSTSQTHSDSTWRDTGVMQVRINLPNLNGSFHEVGHDYDTQGKVFDERYTGGTLTLSGPPILFGQSAAAVGLLLE